MTVATDLLAALDPEQRQVAEALRGPVRVLAGAGTGKTRAITHRIAHGVATGVYAPTEVLAVTFTTRAAGEMRGRLRALGAGGVQARTFHSAALRQLRYFWPRIQRHRAADPDRVQDRPARLGGPPPAAQRRPGPAARPRLRDRVGQGQQRPPRRLRPDRPHPRPLGHRPGPRDRRPGLRQLRGGQARPGPDGHGGRPAPHRRDARRRRAGRRPGPPAVQVVRRRRVPGRLPDPVRAARPVARRPRRAVRGRRPGPDDLLLRRRRRRLPARVPGEVPRHRPRSSWSATTARPPRSSPPPTRCSPAPPAAASSCAPSARPARRSPTRQRPDEVAEAEAVAAQIARLRDAGRSLGEVAVLFRINAQSETFEEALSARGIPYVIRGAARFFDRPEVREAVTRLRGAARSGEADGDARWSRRSAACSPAWAGPPRRRPPAARPATAGSRGRRWSTGHRVRGHPTRRTDLNAFVDDLDRRASEQHAPVADGVTLATFHAAKGLEWDSVFLCGLQDGTLPITYAETPGRDRGGAPAALRRHDPRPASTSRCRGPWPATPAAGPRASRPASSTRCCPTTARVSREQQPRNRKVASCRECGRPLSTGAEKKRGRCADCPASYDEELFERLREWRKDRAGEESVPAFVVFTDATLQLIAEHKPRTPRPCCGSAGSAGEARSLRRGRAQRGRLRQVARRNFREIPIKSFAHDRWEAIVFLRTHTPAHHGLGRTGALTHRRRWLE